MSLSARFNWVWLLSAAMCIMCLGCGTDLDNGIGRGFEVNIQLDPNDDYPPKPPPILPYLDSSFGWGGMVFTQDPLGPSSRDEGIEAIALDSQGRILAAGAASDSSNVNHMILLRYRPDGSLDPAFNGCGFVIHTNASGGTGDEDRAHDVISDSFGRVIVVGRSHDGSGYKMVIWRYNSDGSLDALFGGTGVVLSPGGGIGRAVCLDAGGRIIIAGDHSNTMKTWRYNADGTIDTTFDGDGIAETISSSRIGYDAALDADGKIVVAGRGYPQHIGIWRYNADGSRDTSFDGDGEQTYGVSGCRAFALAIGTGGKIYLTGEIDIGVLEVNGQMFLIVLNPDGSFDTSFSGDGILLEGDAGSDAGYSVLITPTGRINVAGYYVPPSGGLHTALWQYRPDGSPDTNFGDAGRALFYYYFDPWAKDHLLDSGGRIIIGGHINQPLSRAILLARFLP